jgi:hypothetical protein
MGLNEKRNLLASAYQAAPRARWGARQVTVTQAATTLDLTAFCPTAADLGDAPCYDAVISFNTNVIDTGLLSAVVTDDVGELEATHPVTGLEEVDGIRVPGLFPYDATIAGLRTPMFTAAGVLVENYLYLRNQQGAGDLTVQLVFELPDLDWVGGRKGMGLCLPDEYWNAPRVRLNNEGLDNLAASTTLEITDRVPVRADIDDAPFVDLRLTYVIQDVTAGPCIAIGSAVNPEQQIGYRRRPVAAGLCLVETRRLRPRENAAATTLLDGQRVWIRNTDAVNGYADMNICFEAPSLNWI